MQQKRNIPTKDVLSAWLLLLAVIPVVLPLKTVHFFWDTHACHAPMECNASTSLEVQITNMSDHCDLCDEDIQFSPLPTITFISDRIDPLQNISSLKALKGTHPIYTPYLRGPPTSC